MATSALTATTLGFARRFAGRSGQIGQNMEKLKALAEEKSGGKSQIDLFTDAALGDEGKVLESMDTGSIDV